MAYSPDLPFNIPLKLLIPNTVTIKGVPKKYYKEKDIIFCKFRSFGGTETESNGVLHVQDTAVIDTWYRTDIKANCAVETEDGVQYEILGTPEDIEKRHQFLRFKVKAIKGGA